MLKKIEQFPNNIDRQQAKLNLKCNGLHVPFEEIKCFYQNTFRNKMFCFQVTKKLYGKYKKDTRKFS